MNINDKQKRTAGWLLVVAAIVVAGFLGINYPIPPPPAEPDAIQALGTSHFTNVQAEDITATDDLFVTDDATITGTVNLANSLYPLGTATDGQAIYASSATITGTSAITTSTHGLSTVTAAVCDINAAPGTGAGDPAFCVPVVSGTTVTITVKQDDWTTDATSGAVTSYAIIGSP